MDALIRMGAEYGVPIVFAAVLIEQLGVPLPAFPVLMFMGSLAVRGEQSLAALGMVAVGTALWLLRKWWRRYRFSRQLRMDRMVVHDLLALIDRGECPLILDVPSSTGLSEGRIPGALPFGSGPAWPAALHDHPREALIVVYCSCPNDASAVLVARKLLERGFRQVRPLAGGIEAWRAAGREVAL